MDKNFTFFGSAFVAFLFYILLIILFVFYTQDDTVKKIDTINKVTVLQLDIVLENNLEDKNKVNIKSGIKVKQLAQKVVKRTSSSSTKQRSNIKSLFANVKTVAPKINIKKVSTMKKSSISSRYKSKFEKEKKVKNVTLKNMIDNSKTHQLVNKMVLSTSNNKSDPYFSKVNQLLSSRWNPTVFEQDLQAKVLVTISTNGKFDFKFINKSSNNIFNNKLTEFLKAESYKLYPINPTNKVTNIEILFHTKG